jgi:hypothetical protein
VALHALGNDSFYDEEGQLFVHFERDAQGRITGYVTPGHSDRLSFWMQPLVFNSLLSIACMTLLAIVGAVIYRVWRRIFHRRRAALAPQPGTLWMTPSLQLAAWSFVLLLLYLILVVVHLGEVDNFFAIGHLDPWFAGQNFLTALSMLAMASGIVSGLRMMRRPLRFITRLKFALATFSCAYFLWFYVYFHFIGSAHH